MAAPNRDSEAGPVAADRAVTGALAKHEGEERALMRAAYRVMAQHESQTASVQEILAEAGLSTRAFYRHFASKEDLLVAMVREDSTRADAQLAEVVRAAATPTGAILAWIDHWLGLAYDPARLRHTRVLSSDEAVAVAGRRNVRDAVQRTSVAMLAQVLAAGQRSGEFPTAQPDDDARAIQAVVLTLVQARVHREPAPSLSAARAHLVSVLRRLLGGTLSDEA